MTYSEQLQAKEWRDKRNLILERDNNRCTNCQVERTKFLRLSKEFGIKSYAEMRTDGYSIGESLDEENRIVTLVNNSMWDVFFIEEREKFETDKLKFAMQFNEHQGGEFQFNGFRMICFTEDVSRDEKFIDLNVHHKYYIQGRMAWEYSNEALVTLCYKCHKKEHEANDICVYDGFTASNEFGGFLYKTVICERCGGSGFLPEYHYYQGGVCFGCNGHGAVLE